MEHFRSVRTGNALAKKVEDFRVGGSVVLWCKYQPLGEWKALSIPQWSISAIFTGSRSCVLLPSAPPTPALLKEISFRFYGSLWVPLLEVLVPSVTRGLQAAAGLLMFFI